MIKPTKNSIAGRCLCSILILMSALNAYAASDVGRSTLALTIQPEAKIQATLATSSILVDFTVRLTPGTTAYLWEYDTAGADAVPVRQLFQASGSGRYSVLIQHAEPGPIRVRLTSTDGTIDASQIIVEQ